MAKKCKNRYDFCIVRGATFEKSIELRGGFAEVVANPSGYRGVIGFREDQDDNLTNLLTLTVTPVMTTNTLGEVTPLMTFSAAPSVTQTLPQYDIVAYCELQTVAGTTVKRLFISDVGVSD